MKIRIDSQFPHNLITGIFLAKEFDFKFPDKRYVITRKVTDNYFKRNVDVFHVRWPHKTDIPINYKRLADELDVKIQIRRQDNNIDSYGTGNILFFIIFCHILPYCNI